MASYPDSVRFFFALFPNLLHEIIELINYLLSMPKVLGSTEHETHGFLSRFYEIILRPFPKLLHEIIKLIEFLSTPKVFGITED